MPLPSWMRSGPDAALLALCLACCHHAETAEPGPTPSSKRSTPAPVASRRAPETAPLPRERISIPGGEFFAGSVPGDPERVPELEPRRFKVELGPYEIDRLPYPNDPKLPPRTGVDRETARRLCADGGGRLCTELEWERACKGPQSDEFASGAAWDQRCAKEPLTCASGFEVLSLGAAVREWTHSEIRAEKFRGQAALRGAGPGAPPGERRCAARRAADPKLEADDLGFRCCSGAPNAAVVVEPELGRPFEKKKLDAATLQKLLAQSPETASIKDDVVFFKEPDAAQTVLARGPGNTQGFGFTVSPLLWKPVAGSEVLLVAARSGKDRSFVVAFHALGNDEYRLAASFIMLNEPGPVALAYDDGLRPRLHFSTCWGCPGETGKILFRHPERVAIVQP